MKIPAAFQHLVRWFDHEIADVVPEAKADPIGYALDSVSAAERTNISAFLTDALARMTGPGELEAMFVASNARTAFYTESDLRLFLAAIVRRIGEMQEMTVV